MKPVSVLYKPCKINYLLPLIITIITIFFDNIGFAQNLQFNKTLDWEYIQDYRDTTMTDKKFATFPEAIYTEESHFIPVYFEYYRLPYNCEFKVRLTKLVFAPISYELPDDVDLTYKLDVSSHISYQGKIPYAGISFVPFRIDSLTGLIEKLESFSLELELEKFIADQYDKRGGENWTSSSVLASGDWYKISISKSGIYKLDFEFFQSLGLDPTKINPKYIRVYGNGGGMLPQLNSTPRIDDLAENAIFVSGEEDGVFNGNDYVLFYARGPHTWEFNRNIKRYRHILNDYSDKAYYFITISSGEGKRIETLPYLTTSADYTTESFDYYDYHEVSNVTDITKFVKSGRDWFGEDFNYTTTREFPFKAANIDTSHKVYLVASLAARSSIPSYFNIKIDKQSYIQEIPKANTGDYDADYLVLKTPVYSFYPTSGDLDVTLSYSKTTSSSIGWLNYLEINSKNYIVFNGEQLAFRDTGSMVNGISEYKFTSNTNNFIVWDISDINNVKFQDVINQNMKYLFKTQTNIDNLKEFLISSTGTGMVPSIVGKINNQNLHALKNLDMIIVTHPNFMESAEDLADFHRDHDSLSVEIVVAADLYNEFSSGSQDITAIRDFMRMLYEKAEKTDDLPKYLLLFGDGSYDYKNKISNNTNYVPTFESVNSYSPIGSYASDDYFGFLDKLEGDFDKGGNSDLLDLCIGRLPVQTKQQAKDMVNKIMHYSLDQECFGDWRNKILFVADDEDGNIYVNQTESLTVYIDNTYNNYNVSKVYLDAYEQITSPNGSSYPGAEEDLFEKINSGVLLVNYIGHGGEQGWAHERVLDVNDIKSWNNYDKLTLFVTATCEFSRFDDPERTSAGEWALLNPKGGAIALLTTTRVVFSGANSDLINKLYQNNIFADVDGKYSSLGEIVTLAKNRRKSDINTRKFSLLGDPAIMLAYPKYEIATTNINSNPVSANPDTLKALSIVTISGEIRDNSGNRIEEFNGIIYPTIFDKVEEMKTLANDPKSSVTPFDIQKNIIYKGKASVTDGLFIFSFVVPKDISYKKGTGKISYYATDNTIDAKGYYSNIIIGGTADSFVVDNEGPEVELFLNDTNFVSGGLTDENPVMIVKVRDENGINTVGNGIGHELIARIDGGEPIIVNEYYEASLNSYKEGEIRYQFYNLSEGWHTLEIKVWDVANNSAIDFIEFLVGESEKLIIKDLYNYPNPFIENTTFSFEHNKSGENLEVIIQIFSVTGNLLKTIEENIYAEGNRINHIQWNARNEFGRGLSNGIYIYRLILKTSYGMRSQKSQKMIIMK